MRVGAAGIITVYVVSQGRVKSSVSFMFAWDHSCRRKGHRVYSGSCGFTRERVRVSGFILVRVCSFRREKGKPGSRGTRARIGVVVFISVCVVSKGRT